MYRINPRLGIVDKYRSNNGVINYIMDGKDINLDDLFVVGFSPNQQVVNSSIYYSELTYTVTLVLDDGEEKVSTYSVGNTPVGNMTTDIDTSLENGSVYWDVISIYGYTVNAKSLADTLNYILPEDINSGPLTTTNRDIVVEFESGGFPVSVEEDRLSYWSGVVGKRVLLQDATFKLYKNTDVTIDKIIFKNIRPIDIVLEEAINEL